MLSMPPLTATRLVPRHNAVVGTDGGLHRRGAHFVDGDRTGRHRYAGADRCLARRRLAQARRQHAAHKYFVDIFRRDPAALYRGLNRGSTQLRCGQRGQFSLQTAHGGACSTDNNNGFLRHIGIH